MTRTRSGSVRSLLVATALVGMSVAVSGPAKAAVEDASPSFLTMDRMDGTSRFGLQLDWEKLSDVSVTDGFATRAELYFQYVLPLRAIGIYAQMPFAYWANFNGGDEHGIGNPDLGAYYMPGGRQTLIFRAGLTLGVASSDAGAIANRLTVYPRLTDQIDVSPKATALRLSVSTIQTYSIAFVRGDFGFDVAISNKDERDIWMHANAALGLRVPAVDLTGELVNSGALDGPGSFTDRFMHSFAVMLRTRGQNLFHIGTIFPLDSGARGKLWIISLGYQRAFGL
jgi:hypothetical protein